MVETPTRDTSLLQPEALLEHTQNIAEMIRNLQHQSLQATFAEEITTSIHELNDLIQSSAKEAVNTAAIDQSRKVLNQISIIVDQVNREMGKYQV